MKIDIKPKTEFTEGDQTALQELSHAVYPPDDPTVEDVSMIQWSGSTWGAFIRDANQLVAYIGMLVRQGKCDDRPVLIGGIGGVKSHPEVRGKGYASAGMKEAGAFLTQVQKVDFSLLVCRDELIPYYGRLGWQAFDGEMLVDQISGKVKFTFNKPMLLAGVNPIPDCAIIDLCGNPW